MTSKEDSGGISKGDRLLSGISTGGRSSFANAVAGACSPSSHLPPELAEQIASRLTETERLRSGLLQAGLSEDALDNPEGVDIDHLSDAEREQFNDAVREHREFLDEVERDLRERRESRAAIGLQDAGSMPARGLSDVDDNDERA